MNFIFGFGDQIILNKLFTFNKIKLNCKKILFDKINLISKENDEELQNNIAKYHELFDQILYSTDKNYSLSYDEINKLIAFEKLIFELVELKLLDIKYYVDFILNLPEKFLTVYLHTYRTKNYILYVLENDHPNESKKLIDLIKKIFM